MLVSAWNLASQALCYVPNDTTEFDQTEFVRGIIGFVYALKHITQDRSSLPIRHDRFVEYGGNLLCHDEHRAAHPSMQFRIATQNQDTAL